MLTEDLDPPPLSPSPSCTPTVASPTETPSPTTVISSSSTPSPEPTATFAPDRQREAAERAFLDGEYERSIELWRGWLATAPAAQLWWGQLSLARAYLEAGQAREALSILEEWADRLPAEARADALALGARANEAASRWAEAIAAYTRYLEEEPAAALLIRQRIAAAYRALGDLQNAAKTLEEIDLEALPASARAQTLEELAVVRRELQDYEGALAAYERILSFSRYRSYQALIRYRRGETLREAGREDEAREVFQQLVREYSDTPTAHLALRALEERGEIELSDLERGRILYHGRQYAESAQALERHILARPEEDVAEAHYWLAMARVKQGRYAAAFDAFDVLIREYPDHPRTPDAWLAKAEAAEANGGDPSGLYHEFWLRYPHHPRAPEALWLGGEALLRQKEWARAAEFFHRLRTRYPQDAGAAEALFREGLAIYALGDGGSAGALWRTALAEQDGAERQARLLFWLGLAERRAGHEAQAQAYWRAAAERMPWGYYGLRAQDLAAGVEVRMSLSQDLSMPAGEEPSLADDWEALERWVTGWQKEPKTATEAVGAIGRDRRVAAALAVWRLGWHREAQEMLRAVRDEARDDPMALLALARVAQERGIQPVVISCAEMLLSKGRQARAADPPESLQRLAYPMGYVHLIASEAARYAIDPLLFLALIRQESRFDPRAVSYAGATGLTQVMPETGKWIASRVEVGDYRHELLTRPTVSVRFGLWFLGFLLDRYDRDWIAALVAYNAGPGNLERWADGRSIADHDLFFELIPVKQAQDYVRHIYEQYRLYERIYRRSNDRSV